MNDLLDVVSGAEPVLESLPILVGLVIIYFE